MKCVENVKLFVSGHPALLKIKYLNEIQYVFRLSQLFLISLFQILATGFGIH